MPGDYMNNLTWKIFFMPCSQETAWQLPLATWKGRKKYTWWNWSRRNTSSSSQGSAFNCQLHTGCKDYQELVTLLFWMPYCALDQTTNSVVCLVICITAIQILFMHFLRGSVSQFNVLYTFHCSFSQVAFVPTQNCIKRSLPVGTINIKITWFSNKKRITKDLEKIPSLNTQCCNVNMYSS